MRYFFGLQVEGEVLLLGAGVRGGELGQVLRVGLLVHDELGQGQCGLEVGTRLLLVVEDHFEVGVGLGSARELDLLELRDGVIHLGEC